MTFFHIYFFRRICTKLSRIKIINRSSLYRNSDIPYEEALEVNNPISNLIVLSDSYGLKEFLWIGHPNPFDGRDEGDSHTLAYIEAIACLTSSIWDRKEMEAVIASKNEIKKPLFLWNF